jgi:hypothetical protein
VTTAAIVYLVPGTGTFAPCGCPAPDDFTTPALVAHAARCWTFAVAHPEFLRLHRLATVPVYPGIELPTDVEIVSAYTDERRRQPLVTLAGWWLPVCAEGCIPVEYANLEELLAVCWSAWCEPVRGAEPGQIFLAAWVVREAVEAGTMRPETR